MPGDSSKALEYNIHMKGKYAYWVHCRYIISFDHMTEQAYLACEEDIHKLIPCCGKVPMYGVPLIFDTYCDEYIHDYIDLEETTRINSIKEYTLHNSMATDDDITIDMIKKFRTWLAETILNLNKENNEYLSKKDILMLTYYANGMTNNTLEELELFKNQSSSEIISDKCGCGCGSMDINIRSNCDPCSEYKYYIYNYMINRFSDLTFWRQFPIVFVKLFEKYISNIITANLNLDKNNSNVPYYVNNCNGSFISNQEKSLMILDRLVNALRYIINSQVDDHSNYITSAFSDWATKLYEIMEW